MKRSPITPRFHIGRHPDVLTGQMVGIEISLPLVGMFGRGLRARMTILISVFVHEPSLTFVFATSPPCGNNLDLGWQTTGCHAFDDTSWASRRSSCPAVLQIVENL